MLYLKTDVFVDLSKRFFKEKKHIFFCDKVIYQIFSLCFKSFDSTGSNNVIRIHITAFMLNSTLIGVKTSYTGKALVGSVQSWHILL